MNRPNRLQKAGMDAAGSCGGGDNAETNSKTILKDQD